MLNFIEWCKDNDLDLPVELDENTHRSGIRAAYPDAYVRSQYPDAYFAPTSATAFLDLKNAGKGKSVKGGADTAAK